MTRDDPKQACPRFNMVHRENHRLLFRTRSLDVVNQLGIFDIDI